MQIDQNNIGTVFDLLKQGFPDLPVSYWETGLRRMMASPAHESGDEPIGHLLSAGGRYVGVGLTAVSRGTTVDPADGKPLRRVNLAGWYIEPEHRMRLPVLLRPMLSDSSAVYLDLTPSPGVLPILQRLGFNSINDGMLVVNLMMAVVGRSSGANVSVLSNESTVEPTYSRTIRDHIEYGCIALTIRSDMDASTVLLKPVRVKGITLLEFISYEDREFIVRHMVEIARTLIRMGYFGLVMDLAPDERPNTGLRYLPIRGRSLRFAKNAVPNRGADYTYTELVYYPA